MKALISVPVTCVVAVGAKLAEHVWSILLLPRSRATLPGELFCVCKVNRVHNTQGREAKLNQQGKPPADLRYRS